MKLSWLVSLAAAVCAPAAAAAADLLGRDRLLVLHDGAQPVALAAWLARPESEISATETVHLDAYRGHSLVDVHGDGILYRHLVLLSAKMPASLAGEEVVEFVRRGGNVLWALPSEAGAPLEKRTRLLAQELGRILGHSPPPLLDYFGSASDPRLVPTQAAAGLAHRILSTADPAPFRGASHRLDPNNPLVFPILHARETAVSSCPAGSAAGCVATLGTENIVASGLETRVGSRATILSGDSLLRPTDQHLTPTAKDLLSWTFQESGQLRVDVFEHGSLEARRAKPEYRIGDRFQVRVCLSEKRGASQPYQPQQPRDLQIELAMLTPWLRADLSPTPDGCLSTGPIVLPNRYGVFTLRMRYQRRGWPHILRQEKLVLRPFHHDEAIRIILSAAPYYISWLSVLAATALLVFPLVFDSK